MKIRTKRLKRAAALLMAVSLALTGSALAATTVTPAITDVERASGQTTFMLELQVTMSDAFAGLEMGLKVSDETALVCNEYTESSAVRGSQRGPLTLNKGVYYFGFFKGTTSFNKNEAVNIGTLSFTYTGSEEETITLDYIRIITGYNEEKDVTSYYDSTASFTVTVSPDGVSVKNVTPDSDPSPVYPGGSVTPTIVVTEAEVPLAGSLMSVETELENGVIYYYGSNGEEVFVPFCLYIDGVMYFIGNPLIEYYIKENPKSFSDVGSNWAADYIAKITSREIYAGFPDGSFGPNQAMTRAQLAKVLATMASADVSSYTNRVFDDVEPTAWYGPYVAWANSAGIVMGDGNGGFRPDSNVSRQEMAVMLSRFISYMGLSIPEVETGTSFADNDQISDWAKAAASEMQSYGIITGRTGNLFAPVGISTRAEVATMLWRLIEATVTALAS